MARWALGVACALLLGCGRPEPDSQALLEAAHRDWLPRSLDELQPPATESNAAPDVVELGRRFGSGRELRESSDLLMRAAMERDSERVADWLQEHTELVDAARDAGASADLRLEIDADQGLMLDLPHLMPMEVGSIALAASAWLSATRGDFEEALEALDRARNLAWQLRIQPGLAPLQGAGRMTLAVNLMTLRIAELAQLSSDERIRLRRWAETTGPEVDFHQKLQAEAVLCVVEGRRLPADQSPQDFAVVLEFWEETLRLAEPRRFDALHLAEVSDVMRSRQQEFRLSRRELEAVLMPTFGEFFRFYGSVESTERAVPAMVAALEVRSRTGSWPAAADLPAIPGAEWTIEGRKLTFRYGKGDRSSTLTVTGP